MKPRINKKLMTLIDKHKDVIESLLEKHMVRIFKRDMENAIKRFNAKPTYDFKTNKVISKEELKKRFKENPC